MKEQFVLRRLASKNLAVYKVCLHLLDYSTFIIKKLRT